MSKSDDASSSDDTPTDGVPANERPTGSESRQRESSDEPPAAEDGSAADKTESVESDDDLPDWEPLTPELIEEEALRGDVMIRWAAVLLALLLGWTVLDRTEVLVDVKSGQYLLSHGILPPEHDVFSATAADQRWVNLSWLWDLLVGGIDRVAGLSGLSVLSALIAVATFGIVVRTSVPGVSTWWGSVCAVLAAVACFPNLTAIPQIVTLLGVAATLWLLLRREWDPSCSLWPLVGVFLIWGNLDGRAWIGAVILLMFALGTWLDGFRTLPEREVQPAAGRIGLVTLGSLVALLVHPFLWETWLAPLRLYGTEYPVLRSYASSDVPYLYELYPVRAAAFWRNLDYFNGASLLLMLVALVTLLLNRQRLRLSSALVFLAVNLIGLAGGGELAVASIVNAVLATVNGQQWYRANFRQTYSVDPGEVLFSRAGRAVTVIAIFAVAFAAVSGHLMGGQGRRIGMGLSPELSQTVASYQSVLNDSFSDRAFNFRLSQGDLLIWIGIRPFIDSRATLYGTGDSLVPLHQELRLSLRSSAEEATAQRQRQLWTREFDRFDIYQVLPRLTGPVPDYQTYLSLLTSPDWQLTQQGAATAAFYRTNSASGRLADYLSEQQGTQFVAQFLRPADREADNPVPRGVWPQPPSFYETYIYVPDQTTPNDIQLAEHYALLRDVAIQNRRLDRAIALAYGGIRRARDGLREAPHNAAGYRVLADVYRFLESFETGFQLTADQSEPLLSRFFPLITTYHQVLDCEPEDTAAKYRLFELYSTRGRADLALHYLELYEQATGQVTAVGPTHDDYDRQQRTNHQRRAELQQIVENTNQQIREALEEGHDRFSVAQAAYGRGCPQLALDVLEEDLTIAASNPLARMLMAMLLLEVGRGEEALLQFERLRDTPVEEQVPDWPWMTAYCNLAADEILTARATLEESHTRLERMTASTMLETAPMRYAGPALKPDGTVDWGVRQESAVVRHLQAAVAWKSPTQLRLNKIDALRAMIALEVGDLEEASQLLEQIVKRDPDIPARRLIEQYLKLISDEPLTTLPPADADEMPTEPELFSHEDSGSAIK